MAETDGKLAELRYLPEDLLGDEVNAPVLRPEVNLGLEPAGADLDAAVRGGHGCAEVVKTVVQRRAEGGKGNIRDGFSVGTLTVDENHAGDLLRMADAESHLANGRG
ncbi:hypothetical protein DBV15_10428 [Temnothorax longispinosus]|uniref:Uncharacterized protein n=1 Tax=Temnothorax longispinosus TaxID=300112 RepID=A0A4S2KUA5_9HYME|nr:hypothetical protein DBV15_10428 [Temnothorax longispinosus]